MWVPSPHEQEYEEGDFDNDWSLFNAVRAETVALLKSLPAEAEGRLGVSNLYGPLTLLEYATHVVDHDIEHLGQISETRAALGV
jgi:uncharacterized damage-inducible protein DinB